MSQQKFVSKTFQHSFYVKNLLLFAFANGSMLLLLKLANKVVSVEVFSYDVGEAKVGFRQITTNRKNEEIFSQLEHVTFDI